MSRLLTTVEVAKELGLTRGWIHHLIVTGQLPATRLGRAWVVAEEDIDKVRVRRKAGRQRGAKIKAKIVFD